MSTEYLHIGIIVTLLGFIAWRDMQFTKVVDSLTNKLMARDLPEYLRVSKDFEKKEVQQPQKERRKVVVDSVLGAKF